jgi:hypothetical protein
MTGDVLRIQPEQLSAKDRLFIHNREWEFTIEPGRINTEKFEITRTARKEAKIERLTIVKTIAAQKATDRRARLKARKEFQSNEYMLATSLFTHWWYWNNNWNNNYSLSDYHIRRH